MSITFKHGFEYIDFDAVSKWLLEVYWSPGITKDEVILGARNSSLVVGGFDESGKQVSFLRIISDKVRFAYILDVIVDPVWRRQGIGTGMVKYVMEHPEMSLVYQWLLRTRGAHGVYAKLGFIPLPNPDQWMIIQNPREDRSQFQSPPELPAAQLTTTEYCYPEGPKNNYDSPLKMRNPKTSPSIFEPCCLATTIGSLPHSDVTRGTRLMFESTPDIPSWIQFPKRNQYENMLIQFTEGLPGLIQEGEYRYFSVESVDFIEQMVVFYRNYLAVKEENDLQALETFALSPTYAAGFAEFMNQLPEGIASGRARLLKGQVTGPFTLGTNFLDQDRRCSYYDEQLRDIIIKMIAMKAVWQITQLSRFNLPVMIFIDEPSLLGFGKHLFLTISREDVIKDINEVTAAIHAQGGRAGVHCEENTDWSLLMKTDLDILDFDAYDHLQAITLYPAELHAFLDRGGCLGWGIVPTLDREAAATETVPSLLSRFEEGINQLVGKGFDRELLLRRALITPSCGAGGVLTEPLAERVLGLLNQLSQVLRQRHSFV
jgi:GNAT superfamily N-acetyltransferase